MHFVVGSLLRAIQTLWTIYGKWAENGCVEYWFWIFITSLITSIDLCTNIRERYDSENCVEQKFNQRKPTAQEKCDLWVLSHYKWNPFKYFYIANDLKCPHTNKHCAFLHLSTGLSDIKLKNNMHAIATSIPSQHENKKKCKSNVCCMYVNMCKLV